MQRCTWPVLCNGPIPIMANTLEMVRPSIWVGPDERLQRVLFNLRRKDCLTMAACFYLKHLVAGHVNVTLWHKFLLLISSLAGRKNKPTKCETNIQLRITSQWTYPSYFLILVKTQQKLNPQRWVASKENWLPLNRQPVATDWWQKTPATAWLWTVIRWDISWEWHQC